MLKRINKLFGRKPAVKSTPPVPESPTTMASLRRENGERNPTFAKIFRWRLPAGQTTPPQSVEVVGSFSQWQKVPLARDGALDSWHVTVHHMQAHRTHHYMLLVDGQPTYDKNSEGIAVPHGPEEERYQLMTEKGPRVFMVFAQTK